MKKKLLRLEDDTFLAQILKKLSPKTMWFALTKLKLTTRLETENLHTYLDANKMQKELFDMKILVQECVAILEKNYENITFEVVMNDTHISSNKEAFSRILNNLLTNAANYNKKNGSVRVVYDEDEETLHIMGNGKGLQNSKRIFKRFHKKQEHVSGIRLHTVKKLCDALDVNFEVENVIGLGTTFSLRLY